MTKEQESKTKKEQEEKIEKQLVFEDVEKEALETTKKIKKQHQELVEGEKIVEDKERTPEEEQKLKEIREKGQEVTIKAEEKIEEETQEIKINRLKEEIKVIDEAVKKGKMSTTEADLLVKEKERQIYSLEGEKKIAEKGAKETGKKDKETGFFDEKGLTVEKTEEKIETKPEKEIPKERRAELREFLKDFQSAREKLVKAEKNYEKYKGAKGLIKKEEKIKAEREYQQALKEYQEKRAEYVGEKVKRKTKEQARIADQRAEELNKEKGWAKKSYEWYKKLGELNLGKFYKGENKWIRFGLRTLSVRTAVSMGLVGVGLGLGAGSAVGIGALTLRRGLAGLGAGIGSYDMMKMGTEAWAKTKGIRRELSQEELKTLLPGDIEERMAHFELNARLTGKKVSQNETYRKLQREYNKNLESAAKGLIQFHLKDSDQYLEKVRQKSVRNDRIIKGVAAGIGLFIGSGAMNKVIKELWGGKEMPKMPGKAAAETPTAGAPEIPKVPETPPISPFETAQKGDNLWKIVERQFDKQFGDKFTSLGEAEKTFILNAAKDKIAENPQAFGLENINLVKIGQQFDLAKINKLAPEFFKGAGGLTEQAKQVILENNQMLRGLAKLGRSQIENLEDSQLREATNFIGKMGYDPSAGKIVREFGQRLAEAQDNFRGASSNTDKFQGFLEEIQNREKGIGGFFRKLFKGSELPQAEGNLEAALINQQEAGQKLADLTGEPVKPFEAPSVPKAPPVHHMEVPSEIPPAAIGEKIGEAIITPEGTIVTPEGIVAKFSYDTAGNITEIDAKGVIGAMTKPMTGTVEDLFHEDLRERISKTLLEKGSSSGNAKIYMDFAKSRAKNILLLKNLLNHLSPSSAEANFVTKQITNLTNMIERRCGDVLK